MTLCTNVKELIFPNSESISVTELKYFGWMSTKSIIVEEI